MGVNMKIVVCLVALAAVCWAQTAPRSPPKVQVYSHKPGRFEEENVLICHVSGFHPPDITIELMKGDDEIPKANQTDLAFVEDWHFHLTKSVIFTPMKGEKYSCKVTHGSTMKDYAWEPNM